MDLNLRPEHWVLVAILASGIAVLGLQLGQDWTLPDLGPAEELAAPVLGEAKNAPTVPTDPGAPPASPPSGGAAGGAEPSPTGADPAPAAAPHPGPDAPALSLKAQPDSPVTQEPVTVVVALANASSVKAVLFDLVHDPAALAYVEGQHSSVSALYGSGGEPAVEVRAAEPGRLGVSVRRRSGDPLAAATGELFAIVFNAVKPGRSRMSIAGASVVDGAEVRIPARGDEIFIDVR